MIIALEYYMIIKNNEIILKFSLLLPARVLNLSNTR